MDIAAPTYAWTRKEIMHELKEGKKMAARVESKLSHGYLVSPCHCDGCTNQLSTIQVADDLPGDVEHVNGRINQHCYLTCENESTCQMVLYEDSDCFLYGNDSQKTVKQAELPTVAPDHVSICFVKGSVCNAGVLCVRFAEDWTPLTVPPTQAAPLSHAPPAQHASLGTQALRPPPPPF